VHAAQTYTDGTAKAGLALGYFQLFY